MPLIKGITQYTFTFLTLILLQSTFTHAEIYKYQDQSGNWQFSDKKPESSNSNVATVDYKPIVKEQIMPHLETKQANGKLHYTVHNPLLAPVQCFLIDIQTRKKISMKVISPLSSGKLFKQQNSKLKRDVDFTFLIGDPATQPASNSVILPPFRDYKPMRISQAFNGPFSHTHRANYYAVDIGMPVGTKITAVKEGTVIHTKDDYSLSGVSSPFFFDKANVIYILHNDGSYAVYAHLLLGGIKVKVGDKVLAGQVIALSGNTGYSTGPHLHFVIRYNDNGQTNSLPFTFNQPKNKTLEPERGVWLLPALQQQSKN